jgi:hypothetical protein
LNTIKSEEEVREKLLQEIYVLTDEYNKFVVQMDKKLDSVVSKLEGLHEDKTVC